MLTAGSYYDLEVGRISDFGLYLTDGDGCEVLLPNRYVSIEDKIGDRIRVFIYHDSENRLVATRETPLATVGEVAFLEVKDKNIHGAFLNWGLKTKDLFLPNSNQQCRLEIGRKYIVYLYVDNVTGRVTATMRLNGYVNNKEISVHVGDKVRILVGLRSDIGFRVIIDNRHWGMIYHNQLFRSVSVGDTLDAYVSRITDDMRIDISLQRQGYDEVKESAGKLLELLKAGSGCLALTDKSSPEEIMRIAGMSKKVFKRSVGHLLKQGLVTLAEEAVLLK